MKLPSIRCVLGLLPLLLAPLYLRAAQSIKDLSLLGTSHVRNGAIFLVDSGGSVTIGSGATLTIASGGTIVALSGSTVTGFGDGGGGGGNGTVTSVAVSVPAFLQVNSGSPVTSAGTIAIGYSGSALPIANGGTGGTSASAARTALGLEIGTNVHPFSSALTTFATNGSGYYLSRANHSGTQTMATISDAGNAATRNVGTTTGTVAAGDDSRITGAASAAGLLAVNPSGINNGGKVDWTQLMNVPPGIADGSDDGAGGGSGTVTSVGVSVPAFLQITSGSPVTSAGTIAIGYSGSALPIANGGTGGTSASAARTALGLEIGTNVHPFSSALTTFATNGSAHYLSRANHTGTQTMATISDAGNSATRNVGTTAGTVAAGDHTHAGSVTTSGSPTSGQTAEFTSSSAVTGVANTGTGSYVKQIDPVILRPAAAQPADAVDITKDNGTKSYSGNFAWTLSATPPDGQKFGVHLTNSHTAAIVGTLTSWGTVYSTVRQANITSLAAVPPGEWPLLFEKVGSVIKLYNEPVANADLLATKASPALTDYLFLSDQAASGADKKSLISAILSLYDSVTATLTNKTLTAPVLGGTITGAYTLGGTPTFPTSVVQKSTNLISISLTIDAIADGVDYTIVRVPAAFTITQIIGVHEGSGLSSPSVVATFKHGTNRTSATTIEAVTVTSSTTGTVVTSSIDDATVPQDSFIWVTLSSKSGTTANLFVQIVGTYD